MSTAASKKRPLRVALATYSGERVDQHFAKAKYFDIYELVGEENIFIERRENIAGTCGCHGENTVELFRSIIETIADCKYVLANRVGGGALVHLIDHGIRAAVVGDTVPNALQWLRTSGKLEHLLRNY
jgi:nitrogen fixation protein NifB